MGFTIDTKRLTSEDLRENPQWWELYNSSFPEIEREPVSTILKSLELGCGLAFSLEANHQTIGLATTHLLKDPDLIFLVYFALDQKFHGRGLGKHFLERIYRESGNEISRGGRVCSGMIWEVEKPEHSASALENLTRTRRIRFFEKNGGRRLNLKYFQPPVNGDPLEMELMIIEEPLKPPDFNFAGLVRALYFQKYAAVNGISTEVLEKLFAAL